MLKVINGFKTKQDVSETLQWLDANTDYIWNGHFGETPTEFNTWEKQFDEFNENGKFYILLSEKNKKIGYGNINWFNEDDEYEEIKFNYLIKKLKKM